MWHGGTTIERVSQRSSGRRFCVAALLLALMPAVAHADSGSEKLKQARNAYEFGDFAAALHELPASDIDGFPREDDRVEAWKILGLSHFFFGKPTPEAAQQAARSAFFELLKQNPDYQLDPLFVPPDAVAFFESVRRDEEMALAPIRKFRNARKEQEALEREARRQASMHSSSTPPTTLFVDRKVVQNSPVLVFMPLGLGQFQNGNNALGAGLAAGQGVGVLTSIISFLMIEVLRDQASGQFKGDNLRLAHDFDIAKWVGAGLFYGLWVAGGIEAAVHFVPERAVTEPPSAAPSGPLKQPASTSPIVPPAPPAPPVQRPPPPPTPTIEVPPLHPAAPAAPSTLTPRSEGSPTTAPATTAAGAL